jgi:hypothetical protein
MSVGLIIAVGIGIAVFLVVALIAVRQAGGNVGAEESYGRELDAPPPGMRAGRRASPGKRQRAMIAAMAAALAALGAGLATGLSHDHHRAHGTD